MVASCDRAGAGHTCTHVPDRHGRPLLVAVDDDHALLADVERELRNRYVPDYRVCCLRSATDVASAVGEGSIAIQQVHRLLGV